MASTVDYLRAKAAAAGKAYARAARTHRGEGPARRAYIAAINRVLAAEISTTKHRQPRKGGRFHAAAPVSTACDLLSLIGSTANDQSRHA